MIVKIFYSRARLTASDSDTHEAFKSMHQSIMTKVKKYACKVWNGLDIIMKDNMNIFEC